MIILKIQSAKYYTEIMSKIIFINPPLSHEERYGLKVKSGGWTPPLGLAYLSAVVRIRGFEVNILDAAALGMSHEDAANKALSENPQYVGITGSTVAIYNANRVAEWIKKLNNSVITIIGGPHLTALPLETMEKFNSFDIGVVGEGEITIVELLEALELGRDLSEVKGLLFREKGKIIQTDKRPFIKNLDELPTPAWDLLPDLPTYYSPPVHTVKKFPAALLVLSRGCPGKCKFCDRSVFGNICRAHSAEYAINLIKELYVKYGIKEFQIRDDNFLAYRMRLIEFCNLLKRENLNIVWTCAGRVDMINPEILKIMKEAGCWQIWYGVESGNQEMLDFIGKNITLEQITRAITWTKEAGISTGGFFIMGLPNETPITIESTIKFSQELPLDEFHIAFFTPFPGSEFYKTASEYGEFNNDWQKMNGWIPLFVPKGMTIKELEYYSKKAFREFYFRPGQVLNYLKRIRNFKHVKAYFFGFLSLIEFLIKNRNS
jgi:radical SAM superfamily enzyme YgiQ (UPF0313 family)